MTDLLGKTLSQYRIVEEIGRGGMAIVYRAYQPSLKRYVAVKVLYPQLTVDATFVQRFLQEARTAARLDHPNIITIYDVGQAGGTYYIGMRFVEGQTLQQLIQREGALSPARGAHILQQLASALDYAHRQGLIHRDVKPSNVMLGKGDHVTLTDFGIARAAEGTRLTRTGVIVGTPEYMSPQQAQGVEVDHLTDIYSLGVVAYEMLAGRVPFAGTTPHAVLHKHVYETPPPLRAMAPGIPRLVEKAINRALAKDPRKRYQSAGEMGEALTRAVSGLPRRVPTPRPKIKLPTPRPRVRPSKEKARAGGESAATVSGSEIAARPRAPTPLPVERKKAPLLYAGVILAVGLVFLGILLLKPDNGLTPTPTVTAGPSALVAMATRTPTLPKGYTATPIRSMVSTSVPTLHFTLETPGCPPDLVVFKPEIDGCTVTINGVVASPCNDPVPFIHWNWGDGTEHDSWFAATHTYSQSGTYQVTVTAYTAAGYSASDTKTVTIITMGRAKSVTATAKSVSHTPTPAGPLRITATNADRVTLLRTLTGHTGWVGSVTFSPDGATLASPSGDRTVRLWRVSDGVLSRTLEGHTGEVYSVAFSPDGAILASGAMDHTVRVWQVSDGTVRCTLQVGERAWARILSFDPSGRYVAGDSAEIARVWDVSTCELTRIIHGTAGTCVAFSPDGQLLASGSQFQGEVRMVRMSDGSLLRTISGHRDPVYALAFSPDGEVLASGAGWEVRLWRVADGALLSTLKGHEGSIHTVAFSPDGAVLASGSRDNTVRLWRVADGKLVGRLTGHALEVNGVAFSPDGATLASGSGDGTVRLWRVQSR